MKASNQITQAIDKADIANQGIHNELGLYVEAAKAHELAALCWTTKGAEAWHSSPINAMEATIRASKMSRCLDDNSINETGKAYRKALIAALAAAELGTDHEQFQITAKAAMEAHESTSRDIQGTAEFIIDDHKEW